MKWNLKIRYPFPDLLFEERFKHSHDSIEIERFIDNVEALEPERESLLDQLDHFLRVIWSEEFRVLKAQTSHVED